MKERTELVFLWQGYVSWSCLELHHHSLHSVISLGSLWLLLICVRTVAPLIQNCYSECKNIGSSICVLSSQVESAFLWSAQSCLLTIHTDIVQGSCCLLKSCDEAMTGFYHHWLFVRKEIISKYVWTAVMALLCRNNWVYRLLTCGFLPHSCKPATEHFILWSCCTVYEV